MVQTPAAFAQHARSSNLTNSPSAHRRAGGLGSAQHASPPSSQPFSRPFSNVAFPGTVAGSRAAIPSNNTAAPHRGIQQLSLLTTQTPASLAKLSFSPQTTVLWQRLVRRNPEVAADDAQEQHHQGFAEQATSSSTGSREALKATWDLGVQDIITSVRKARTRSSDADQSGKVADEGIRLLLRDPLVSTSTSATSQAELWLFAGTTDDAESGSQQATNAVSDSNTNTQANKADPTAMDLSTAGAAQSNTATSSSFEAALARRLPSDVVKCLARLSDVADISSGSYLLASAAAKGGDTKGKTSSLTTEQHRAHKRFMAAIRSRAVGSVVQNSAGKQANGRAASISPRSDRSYLRVGGNVVFLPTARDGKTSDTAWFAGPEAGNTFADGTDRHSLITRLDVSLTSAALYVRAASQRLAALPLSGTRQAQLGVSTNSPARASLLLAPIGCHADLLGIVSASSIAGEHMTELRSLFAMSAVDATHSQADGATDSEALFASGLAICALHATDVATNASQDRFHQQEQNAPLDTFAAMEAQDHDMDLSSLSVPNQHDQPQSQQQPKHFLWPVSWCLVVQSRTNANSRGPQTSARNNLQSMRDQPMTPLKELVSFTLKVLSDANNNSMSQVTAPYTPGEPDDAPLSRHRVDRLSSTRPDVTPASITFPDFDFAMPTTASANSSHSLPPAGQSVPSTSPAKREVTNNERASNTNNGEQMGDDINWMQFLPQASEGGATASAPAVATYSAAQVDRIDPNSSGQGPSVSTNAVASFKNDNTDAQANAVDSNWAFQMGSASAPPDAGSTAASSSAAQGLVPPQSLHPMNSQGSTPFQANDTTPLGFAAPQTKRKAGEPDIFGNLGLLTEDDFSFFDESAFGLESDDVMADPSASFQQQLEQPAGFHRPTSLSSNNAVFGQPSAANNPSNPQDEAASAMSQAVMSSATAINDIAMDDINQNSLDALFSAIPGLQDAIVTSEPSQAQDTAHASSSSSGAGLNAAQARAGHGASQSTAMTGVSPAQPAQPVMSSSTPRDVSGATPFGDPASLPGFTPSSLTESSPAFGNQNHKTPRTPYSPVEEFRDGATIVDLQNANRVGESAQSYDERNVAAAQDVSSQQSFGEQKAEPYAKGDQFRLADASTAAAAAANAAMDNDSASRKRPAIVPNAFLPLAQPEARKPLARIAAGARANLGRKYELLGKFASKPKTATTVMTTSNAPNATATDQRPSHDPRNSNDRIDRASAPEPGRPRQAPLAAHFGLGATRPSPSKTPSRRGQALLQLRRDRHTKASPGSGSANPRRASGQRKLNGPSTPRSSDDIVIPAALSGTDSDTSSSGDDDSDDGQSVTEGQIVTLSLEEQAMLKSFSHEIVTSYLRGSNHVLPGGEGPGYELMLPKPSALPVTLSARGSANALPRPAVKRWMLSRSARWLVQNPQFRSMYGSVNHSTTSDVAMGEKLEVLESFASALCITNPSPAEQVSQSESAAAANDAEASLPTLHSLVQPSPANSRELVRVLEPTKIAVGCQGSVVEALPSALTLWDKSKLSAVSGQKHVVAKVLLTHASPAWHDEIVAWLDRLRNAFESHGLGTHVGGPQSILAVADGSESLALSSYLDRLWKDGETWLDTLRSIASRVQVDLLQGKHVVLYTLQPPYSASCSATGYHGLLRLEMDLRSMLSEQVGVLAEQLLVRPVSPSMMTESGSLGFSQQTHSLRRLAFSVYDQLPRLVRRQPAKVLHGREPGPVSAIVQFPAFSISTKSEIGGPGTDKEGRTSFLLSWPEEPATAVDEQVLLHVSYCVCRPGSREEVSSQQQHLHLQQQFGGDRRVSDSDRAASFDAASGIFGLSNFASPDTRFDATMPSSRDEKLVMVSAIDERGGSSTVDVLAASPGGDLSIESCVERVWRFALAEASRARLRWRLAISSAGLIGEREQRAWQRLISAYLSATDAKERVTGSIALLCVRPDECGAILADRGGKTRPSQEWMQQVPAAEKASSAVLLDAADFSQVLKFGEPIPMGWTQPFDCSHVEEVESDEEREASNELAMPVSSAILVHKARQGTASASNHVMAVDLVQTWETFSQHGKPASSSEAKQESVESDTMDAVMQSLHRLRLVSEERHQLPSPFNEQPWPVGSVNMLGAYLGKVVLVD